MLPSSQPKDGATVAHAPPPLSQPRSEADAAHAAPASFAPPPAAPPADIPRDRKASEAAPTELLVASVEAMTIAPPRASAAPQAAGGEGSQA